MKTPKLIAMRSIFALLVSIAPSCLVAQSTEADLRARLIDKPLYLRGQWSDGKLAFDGVGHLRGTSAPGTFTLAGVEIGSVKLTSKGLVLGGQRVALEFTKDVPKRIALFWPNSFGGTSPEEITIKIDMPSNGDFAPALDAILTGSIAGFDAPMPWCWQQYAQEHFFPPSKSPAAGIVPYAATVGVPQPSETSKMPQVIGGSVLAPRLLKSSGTQFSGPGRWIKFKGTVALSLVVQANGIPTQISILHPIGLGLDEQVIAAVSQWKYQPATENGSPVAVMLNVEFNYEM